MEHLVCALLEAVLLVTALCMDALVASFAYGADGIRIPWRSVGVIDLVCTSTLALSLVAGNLLQPYLPLPLTRLLYYNIKHIIL